MEEPNRFWRRGARLWWLCPGCDRWHGVPTREAENEGKPWSQTGDDETPTLSPSLKVHWKEGTTDFVCHFFLRGGRIDFCGDCFHGLAGKKGVEVQAVPSFLWNA